MTRASVEFHPAATDDAEGAQRWYAERSPVAARAFLADLIDSVAMISEAPVRSPSHLADTRRYIFSKFPFSLVYRVRDNEIVVIAVAHHRRLPGYWSKRE